ncbi:hypothetical protein Cgig2_012417 [Carnegiea gigantea]|uniref:GIY-YIG domain-containing protein n=1 Tax=Carnegiea gigantea TaxID=171969 RepID=A0A9Q1QKW9_9CARY|nr:hypothetical protein Cgig2_012417 [Carnegiea gigantea]
MRLKEPEPKVSICDPHVNTANAARCQTSSALSKTILAAETEVLKQEVKSSVTSLCQKKLIELYKRANLSLIPEINCILIAAKEQPPSSTIGASSVYVMLRPDKKLYVGETDDLQGRVQAHRATEDIQNVEFLFFIVQGKSIACQLETLLINQLPKRGYNLTNIADGEHRNFGTSHVILEPVTVYMKPRFLWLHFCKCYLFHSSFFLFVGQADEYLSFGSQDNQAVLW